LLTDKSAAPVPALLIVVFAVDVLFAKFTSPADVLATAVFARLPAAVGRPTIVMVALAPGAKSPKLPVTTPPEVDTLPVLEVAETSVKPVGNTSLMVVAVAVFVPLLLVTVIV
jgi:hypothetical protein